MNNRKVRNVILIIILVVTELFFIFLAPGLWGAEKAYQAWGYLHIVMACLLLLIQYIDKRKDK